MCDSLNYLISGGGTLGFIVSYAKSITCPEYVNDFIDKLVQLVYFYLQRLIIVFRTLKLAKYLKLCTH